MCYCESEAVRVLIHVKARILFPGIRYNEEALERVAQAFQLRSTFQVHTLSNAQLAEIADALVRELPASACPPAYRSVQFINE